MKILRSAILLLACLTVCALVARAAAEKAEAEPASHRAIEDPQVTPVDRCCPPVIIGQRSRPDPGVAGIDQREHWVGPSRHAGRSVEPIGVVSSSL